MSVSSDFSDSNANRDREMSELDSIISLCSSLQLQLSDFNTFMTLVHDRDVDNVVSTFQTEYLAMTDDDGLTPLHVACQSGHLELVTLLCHTSNIETRDKYNYRPIHVACIQGHVGVVEHLHRHGCDIEAPGNFGNRPLHLASEHGRLDVVKYLCGHQCQLNVPNCNSRRPIHFACRFGHPEIVRHLCEKGCDKEALTDRGERPIHIACIHGHLEIVRLLCEQGCDIEALTPDNYRPIHLACQYDHVAIVEYLCQQKCNIEALSMFDCRPIHMAVLNGHIDIVRYLCQQRCEIEAFTKMGKSVFDLAIQKGRQWILELLFDESLKRQLIKKISTMAVKCDVNCDHSFCFQSLSSTKSKSSAIIGRGHFGVVFKMKDPQLNYTFCIKSIYLDPDGTNQKAKHIEFNINNYVHAFHHQRIVQYFGTIDNGEEMYIFMEYVEGKSLDRHMNKKSLPHNKIIQYSKEILEGLKFLHRNKIIHRDIKPQNIMVNADDHVKLCDFGLSCYLESIGQKSQVHNADTSSQMTFCGTPNYMAPELLIARKYSYPVDIWGLGASVVEMLTGVPPFHGLDSFAVLFQIGNVQKIEFVPVVPMSENMKSFVEHMLCSTPSKRATAEMLLEFISCMF